MVGEREACAELCQVLDRVKSPFCGFANEVRVRNEEERKGLVTGTTDTAAQLMQLRKTKFVRPIHDDGIRSGNIDTALYDGATDQDVKTLMVEISHYRFQSAFWHLTVADLDRALRNKFS